MDLESQQWNKVSRKMKSELLTLLEQPSSQGFKDPQPDTMELTNSHEETLPEENLVEQKTINTLV
jgi:hypothetical protein